MIVVSGGLVLVAIVLLIIGLLSEGLTMVYASIVVSLVAGVFLLLGALQRRNEEQSPADGAAPDTSGSDALERVGAVSVSRPTSAAGAPVEEEREAADEYSDEELADELGPLVTIVPGRPRYHVSTCRFLAGRNDVEAVPVDAAREQGYTACGVCKPDQMVEAALLAAEEDEPVDTYVDQDALDETYAEEPEAPAAAAPAKRARATKATAGATATAAPAKTATRGAQVVVIPDRDKFHTQTCRFVRDVPGTITVSKATAKRQGYKPCGVCKPD